jgi:hypothetical protein
MKPKASRFDRCLLVINPFGSSYKRSEKLRLSLSRNFPGDQLTVVRLTKAEFSSHKHLRKELAKLDDTILLAIIGGDGTVRFVISELLQARSKKALKATILPLWGGNASDLAHMANGRRRSSVRQILRRGQRVAVKPMEYTLRAGRKTEEGFAMCYISFGAVASTAEVLDKSKLIRLTSKLPAVRLLAEVAVGFYGLARASRFLASATRQHEKLYDLLLINGPRMAKLYRTPAKLSSPDFIELIVRHKYPLFVTHVSRLTRVWVRSTTIRQRQLTVHEPTWMQTDGEVRKLEAETAVRIKPARQSLYLLVTK